jgi:hypothetical protein
MKSVVFWDVKPRGFCNSRRFEGKYLLHHQSDKNQRAKNNVSSNNNRSMLRKKMLCYGPTSPILVTLMMEEILSYETSDLTRATRRNIPEDGVLLVL